MHNSFIHYQYVCYITILDIFRALKCPFSGGQIVLSQHLVSSLSVNGCTVCRIRPDCSAVWSHPALKLVNEISLYSYLAELYRAHTKIIP